MRHRLAGFDIGSTTTRALVVDATMTTGASGRLEVAAANPVATPPPALTPFTGAGLDLPALVALADAWLAGTTPDGGAVLFTGLAAAAPNVAEVEAALRARVGDALAVTASDPGLEAWIAFQGATRALSLAEPGRWFVNLDLGGGTTNLAAGRGGEVEWVGCVRVGARHVRVRPDGRILGSSPVGDAMLAHLGASRIDLAEAEREALARLVVDCLEAAVGGRDPPVPDLVELPFQPLPEDDVVYTLSGGVGELAHGPDLPPETFDDLGVRIARRLRASLLGRNLRTHPTPRAGAATVVGLALSSTDHAGSTVYAPSLPDTDLPIRARLAAAGSLAAIGLGGAFQLVGCPSDLAGVRALAERLAAALSDRSTVVLVDADIALALGNLATRWGARPRSLVVLDGLPPRPARVVRLRRGPGGIRVRYFGFL